MKDPKSAGYDEAGWRLPSGLQLAEFALRGGFIAPGLMPKPGASLPSSLGRNWNRAVTEPSPKRAARRGAVATKERISTDV